MDQATLLKLRDRTPDKTLASLISEVLQFKTVAKAEQPLYVCRYVLNAKQVLKWFRKQGLEQTLKAKALHVTIAYSKDAVDWSDFTPDTRILTISNTKRRKVAKLGDALVQKFKSNRLQKRFEQFTKGGCSWDFPSYIPHVSVVYDSHNNIDLDKIKPYTGKLILGPEVFDKPDPPKSVKSSLIYEFDYEALASKKVKASIPHDGDKYFEINKNDYKSRMSRETLIHMNTADFLKMLPPNDSPIPRKLENVADLVKQGIKFSSIPFLKFDIDKNNLATVEGHEGRHRVTYLHSIGVKSIPVSFLSREGGAKKAIRWGARNTPGTYEYIEQFPALLRGEDNNNKIPFPESDIYPRTNKALARDTEFEEDQHPRLKDGEFAPKNGGGKETVKSGHKPAIKDKDGKLVAADGGELPQHIKDLKIPPAWNHVSYHTDPNGSLLVAGKDTKGRPVAIYSLKFQAEQAAVKFARIKELDEKYDKIFKQNEKARKSDNPTTRAAADCAYLIMQMGIRPGSDADTGAKVKAYGATNMLGKHVVVDTKGKVSLQFTGKKGVALNLPVEDKKVAAMLKERKEKAGDDGKLFEGLNEDKLLNHVHSFDGGSFKTKDFRTRLATAKAAELINKEEPPKNQKEYQKKVNMVGEHVSKILGNTRVVALQSYINPSVFANWSAHS